MTYNFNRDPEENLRAAVALAGFVFCACILGILALALVSAIAG